MKVPYRPATPEQLDAAAQVTPQDIGAAQEFWRYWGTPLFIALLDAGAETAAKPRQR